MRKIVIFLVGLRAIGINGENLIVNAGFEDGILPWELGNSAIIVEANVHSGSKALFVNSDGGPLTNLRGLQAHTTYEISLTIDLASTLLELAGVEAPSVMQGTSLTPLLQGKTKGWREDFFIENMFMGQNYPRYEGVRSDEWKYMRYYAKANDQHHVLSLIAPFFGEKAVFEELYHLTVDPLEKDNVAEVSDNKAVLEHFRARCDVLLHEAKGDAKVPDTYIQNWSKEEFRTKVEAKYKALEAQF